VLDDREGAELEAGDVGEHGGAARGDLVLGEEGVELAEGVVDAAGGVEGIVGVSVEEGGGAVAVVAMVGLDGVLAAKVRVRVFDRDAAAASGRPAMVAAVGSGVNGLR